MDECVFCGVKNARLNTCLKALVVPWTAFSMARWLVTGLSPWRHRSDRGFVHVRHVVDKVVLGQISLPVLPFSHLSIIPLVAHTHSHFNTIEKRTSVSSFKLSNKVIHFQMVRNIGEKITFTFFSVLERMKLSYCGQGRMYLSIMSEDSIYDV